MNHDLQTTAKPFIQSRPLIFDRILRLARKQRGLKENSVPLILFDQLPKRHQIAWTVLWDCCAALKIQPQILNQQIYVTAKDLKRLEQFIKRIEIAWGCPYILATCGEEVLIKRGSLGWS